MTARLCGVLRVAAASCSFSPSLPLINLVVLTDLMLACWLSVLKLIQTNRIYIRSHTNILKWMWMYWLLNAPTFLLFSHFRFSHCWSMQPINPAVFLGKFSWTRKLRGTDMERHWKQSKFSLLYCVYSQFCPWVKLSGTDEAHFIPCNDNVEEESIHTVQPALSLFLSTHNLLMTAPSNYYFSPHINLETRHLPHCVFAWWARLLII